MFNILICLFYFRTAAFGLGFDSISGRLFSTASWKDFKEWIIESYLLVDLLLAAPQLIQLFVT